MFLISSLFQDLVMQDSSNSQDTSPIVINPTGQAKWSMIWLHGLGADGHDFVPIASQLGIPAEAAVRFVFPHAPVRPITINGGMSMRGWYDILSLELDRKEDKTGVLESVDSVHQLIESEMESLASENIILAGFSQGGAIALHAGLSCKYRLGGIIALSTYVPLSESYPQHINATNLHTPIFMAHGTQDPVVPITKGHNSFVLLNDAGCNIQWFDYSMPHSVSPQQIQDIAQFVGNIISQ